MIEKHRMDSHTVMTEMVLWEHVNGTGRLFGGQLMSWMDICGGICAKRHCGGEAVTASAQNLEFLKAAKPNDIVVITASLISVGNTSMKIRVTAEVEDYSSHKRKRTVTCSALFIYVAIDKDGVKHTVPRLIDPIN